MALSFYIRSQDNPKICLNKRKLCYTYKCKHTRYKSYIHKINKQLIKHYPLANYVKSSHSVGCHVYWNDSLCIRCVYTEFVYKMHIHVYRICIQRVYIQKLHVYKMCIYRIFIQDVYIQELCTTCVQHVYWGPDTSLWRCPPLPPKNNNRTAFPGVTIINARAWKLFGIVNNIILKVTCI